MEYHKSVMKIALSGSLRELMTRNLFEKIQSRKYAMRLALSAQRSIIILMISMTV